MTRISRSRGAAPFRAMRNRTAGLPRSQETEKPHTLRCGALSTGGGALRWPWGSTLVRTDGPPPFRAVHSPLLTGGPASENSTGSPGRLQAWRAGTVQAGRGTGSASGDESADPGGADLKCTALAANRVLSSLSPTVWAELPLIAAQPTHREWPALRCLTSSFNRRVPLLVIDHLAPPGHMRQASRGLATHLRCARSWVGRKRRWAPSARWRLVGAVSRGDAFFLPVTGPVRVPGHHANRHARAPPARHSRVARGTR